MGPPNLSPTDRAPKRVRTDAASLFSPRNRESFPKYHVLHCEQSAMKARAISPFLVAKCLKETIGTGYKATKMASGDLLLELKDLEQYNKLSHLVAFGNIPVSVSPHRTMNTVKGVVSDEDLMTLSDEELLDGWKDQGVTHVQRITIRRNNTEIATKHLILTFSSTTLPENLETGYVKLHVRPYIPNPRRCFKCQRFGHGSQSCRGQLTCAKCGTTGHSTDHRKNDEFHCANCDGSHPAYSRSCAAWKKEKEIITVKVKENITFREARQRISPLFSLRTSFAEVVQRGAAPQRPLAVARTTPSVPRLKPLAPPVGAASAALPAVNMSTPVASTSSGSSQGNDEAKGVPSTSGLVGAKISSTAAKSTLRKHRSVERLSVASQEAMDTTGPPAQAAPKERRASLDRSKKDKTPVTGPGKGSVK